MKKPTMFILFILSHGGDNGRIYTDHPLVAGADKSKLVPEDTQSYLLSEITDGLKKMPFADECLFLIIVAVSCVTRLLLPHPYVVYIVNVKTIHNIYLPLLRCP
jgi:hypothetical protein